MGAVESRSDRTDGAEFYLRRGAARRWIGGKSTYEKMTSRSRNEFAEFYLEDSFVPGRIEADRRRNGDAFRWLRRCVRSRTRLLLYTRLLCTRERINAEWDSIDNLAPRYSVKLIIDVNRKLDVRYACGRIVRSQGLS